MIPEKVLRIINEYREILKHHDKDAEFIKGQLFALKIIEHELRYDKYDRYIANAIRSGEA